MKPMKNTDEVEFSTFAQWRTRWHEIHKLKTDWSFFKKPSRFSSEVRISAADRPSQWNKSLWVLDSWSDKTKQNPDWTVNLPFFAEFRLKLCRWTRQFVSSMLEMNPAIRQSRSELNPKEKRQFSCFYHICFPCFSISLCLYKHILDKVFW